jgi:hypothetical protein
MIEQVDIVCRDQANVLRIHAHILDIIGHHVQDALIAVHGFIR